MTNKLQKATGVFEKWSSILCDTTLDLTKRILCFRAALYSLGWQCGSWTLAKKQESHVASWDALFHSHMLGVRRGPEEDIGTYTHLLHANVSSHNTCTFCLRTLRTSSCVSHTRMAQVSVKEVCACVIPLHLAFSILMFHPSLLILHGHFRDHSRQRLHWRSHPHDLALLSRPKSAGHASLRICITKFDYLAKSDANTGYDPNEFDKITSVDDDTILINDPNHNFSDFSKTTNENIRQFGVLTVFESSVLHVSHDNFALQVESKESMQ